jgi:hypothetical protein
MAVWQQVFLLAGPLVSIDEAPIILPLLISLAAALVDSCCGVRSSKLRLWIEAPADLNQQLCLLTNPLPLPPYPPSPRTLHRGPPPHHRHLNTRCLRADPAIVEE